MQTSKLKKLKGLLVPLLVVVLLIAAEAGIGYLVVPVNSATYLKKEIAEYEKNGVDAGIVFLGSSRVYQSFVPEVFEEKLGMDLVINAGSATQRPESSYYLLLDLYERVHPKVVVLGVQWNCILKESTDAQRLESAVTACDRMSVKGKLRYVPNYLFSEQLPYFCNMYRYRDNFKFDKIKETLDKHKSLETEGIVVDTAKNTYYHGKGFIYANVHCENGNIPIMDENQDHFSADEIDESKIKYIDKIYEFCKEKNIRLIFVASPVSMMNMYHIAGYGDAIKYYEEYTKERDIPFHDLNLLQGREEIFTDDLMSDYIHLSGDAAMILSDIYADILKKELNGEDSSDLFYPDLDAMKADVHRVVALKASIDLNDDSSDHISIEALANKEETLLYRVEAIKEDDENLVLADWNENSVMDVPVPEGYEKFMIKACLKGDEDHFAWREYAVKR